MQSAKRLTSFYPITLVSISLLLLIGGASVFFEKDVSELERLNLTVESLNYTTKQLPLVGDPDYSRQHIQALTSFYQLPKKVSDGKSVFQRNDFSAWKPYHVNQQGENDEIAVSLVSSVLYYHTISDQDSLTKALSRFEAYGDDNFYTSLRLITQSQPWAPDDFMFVRHSTHNNPFNILLLQQAALEVESRGAYRDFIQLSTNDDFDNVINPRLYYKASWSLNDPWLSLKAFGKLFYSQWEISLGALLSVAIWFVYLLGLQKFEKRNRWVFFGGFLLTFFLTEAFGPTVYSWFDAVHENNSSLFLYYLGVVGPAEELLKVIPFILLVFLLKGKEPIDRLLLVGFCALGFAACENVGKFGEYGIEILADRSILCCMGHVATISFCVYIVFLSQRCSSWFFPLKWIFAFVVACVMHGLYDYFLVVGYDLIGLSLVLEILAIFLLKIMYENAINHSENFDWAKVKPVRWFQEPLILCWLVLIGIQFALASSVYGVDYARYNLISSALFLLIYSFLLIRNLIGIKLAKGFYARIGLTSLFQKNYIGEIFTKSFQFKWEHGSDHFKPLKGELLGQFTLDNDPGYFVWQRKDHMERYVLYVKEVVSHRKKYEWACQVFTVPEGGIERVDVMNLVCSGKMKIDK